LIVWEGASAPSSSLRFDPCGIEQLRLARVRSRTFGPNIAILHLLR
jgi:hypothetical protein